MNPRGIRLIVTRSLDRWRWANAKRENEAGRRHYPFGNDEQLREGEHRRRLIGNTDDGARVGYRAQRTLVAGEFGIVSVDVDGLGKSAERDQQNSGQSQKLDRRRNAVCADAEHWIQPKLETLYRLWHRKNDRKIDAAR